jgi:pyridoxamine 5'-phosphate oxidase family protein
MSVFTSAELAYLRTQKLGRLATLGPDGAPQVRPVGFAVDEATGTIDIIGRDNPSTQKWRNVARDGRVAFVVDDLAPGGGWNPRALEVRGRAETLPDAASHAFPGAPPGVIRIRPERVLAFGIEQDGPGNRRVTAG